MTNWLSSADLARLRSDVLDTLPDTMDIQRTTSGSDAAGYPSESLATVASSVACRIDPVQREGILEAGEREAMRVDYQLTCTHGTDLRNGDQVIVNGATLEVVSVGKQLSSALVLRAMVIEVG